MNFELENIPGIRQTHLLSQEAKDLYKILTSEKAVNAIKIHE